MNLFEGRLEVDEPGHALIVSEQLGGSIYVDHGVTGATGTTVWAALRPEKVEMAPAGGGAAAPALPGVPEGCNVVAGAVRRASYLGSETIYDVTLAGGGTMRVRRANVARYEDRGFADGDPVWLSWAPRSPAVLLS